MKTSNRGDAWTTAYLSTLVGAQVDGVFINKDGFPVVRFVKKVRGGDPKVYECEVSCDPEGNGAGFLFGLPDPSPEDVDRWHGCGRAAASKRA